MEASAVRPWRDAASHRRHSVPVDTPAHAIPELSNSGGEPVAGCLSHQRQDSQTRIRVVPHARGRAEAGAEHVQVGRRHSSIRGRDTVEHGESEVDQSETLREGVGAVQTDQEVLGRDIAMDDLRRFEHFDNAKKVIGQASRDASEIRPSESGAQWDCAMSI